MLRRTATCDVCGCMVFTDKDQKKKEDPTRKLYDYECPRCHNKSQASKYLSSAFFPFSGIINRLLGNFWDKAVAAEEKRRSTCPRCGSLSAQPDSYLNIDDVAEYECQDCKKVFDVYGSWNKSKGFVWLLHLKIIFLYLGELCGIPVLELGEKGLRREREHELSHRKAAVCIEKSKITEPGDECMIRHWNCDVAIVDVYDMNGKNLGSTGASRFLVNGKNADYRFA